MKLNLEGQTYAQRLGFFLIILGILYFLTFLLPIPVYFIAQDKLIGGKVSVAFFTVMLGMALTFPDMLKGQTKELSTMRIVVFMLINVICMLFLKIGWDVKSLADVGLDANWMGIIAFLFGAKATQYYFETHKKVVPPQDNVVEDDTKQLSFNAIETAQIAVQQHKHWLDLKYPNIQTISDTLKNKESQVTIYLKDDQTEGIPQELITNLPNGNTIKVPTEIVTNVGEAKTHASPRQVTDAISFSEDGSGFGSICCVVCDENNSNFKALVVSGHVVTGRQYKSYGLVDDKNWKAYIDNTQQGYLYGQLMDEYNDIAFVALDENFDSNGYEAFSKGFYKVSHNDYDTQNTKVMLISKVSGEREAHILDHNFPVPMEYLRYGQPSKVFKKTIKNAILIGNNSEREQSASVSKRGDSGGCVYHKDTRKLIGIIVGGNNKFTYVLPIEEALNNFGFKLY